MLNKQIVTSIIGLTTLAATANDKPNIILIMTDQQSYDAISAHRDMYSNSYFSTPNIDRLVNNGISFTRTYCSNPVSVPSRFALFTGMYGGQYNIRENKTIDASEDEVRTLLSTNAMGEVFKKGGYDTYYGGKVHLPFSGATGESKFAKPIGYGFEYCYTEDERQGLGDAAAQIIEKKKSSDKPFILVASFLNPHDICLESSTNISTEVKGKGNGKKGLITETVKMMRARAAAIDSVEFYSKHVPSLPTNFEITKDFPKFKKSTFKNFPNWYWQKYRWTYGQLVSLVDSHIGTILDALDKNPELKKNTIIIFTSDHGEMQGAHHTVTKNLPFEECQRVPLIMCGAGIPKGKKDDTLICNGVDLLPTLCDFAGISHPQKEDGVSISLNAQGKKNNISRNYIIVEGDGFKSVIKDNYKYTIFDKTGAEVLINLKNDAGEMINIIKDNAKLAADLNKLIK